MSSASHPRTRLTAFVVALGLALVACRASTEGPGAIGDPALNQPSGGGSPSASAATTHPGTSSNPSPGATTTAQPTRSQPAAGYQDAGGVGSMARAYLRAGPATRLIVEVDWVRGREPSRVALDHLLSILRRELRKPDGIVIERSDEITRERGSYSVQDLVAVEQRYRDRRSGGSTATMYLVFLDGEFRDVDGAIGVAFLASAAAIFADQIGSAATPLIGTAAIERSVVTHEVGHLLALVNLGYTSRHDHEDPEHRYHSRYRESVMYWAVEDISVTSILTGGPPDDFDRFDRDDLSFLRGD